MKKLLNFIINKFKKVVHEFEPDPPRERLKLLHTIVTNKALYLIYNTQTVQRDAVNIEIERTSFSTNKVENILEDEIYDNSMGGMCGDSFNSLVIDALNHLRKYIHNNKEKIKSDEINKDVRL